MTNRVVMDKARELWLKEIFRKKLCAENPALSGSNRLRYVAKREWDSVTDTRALSTRKVARKTSKHTRESVYSHACLSFRDDYYDNYFMTHPDDYILTPEGGGHEGCRQSMAFFGSWGQSCIFS
ncbi:unnamed protein product [Cuscuta campestris]|uniref:Uncharacterized protein n=1 Tax=Cuscuta campestris TaxID=132261 RepID=A0A484JYY7_9ASTE|nr:unnamed protein product [Cuscuta campestris]